MSSQFPIKDYLNYTISGVLWMVFLGYILRQLDIISDVSISNFIQQKNISLLGFVIVFFGGYTLGNILRFTDHIIRWLNEHLFGNPYYYAIFQDKNLLIENKSLGWIGNINKSKILSLGKRNSELIEIRLAKYGLLKKDKKAQYLLAENFLSSKMSCKKAERMNDLKNFYDSISASVLAIFISLLFETLKSSLCCYVKILIFVITLIIIYQFVARYRFLFSNFIKETYRCFLFFD